MDDFTCTYDEAKRTATIKVHKSGETCRISNISAAQADLWAKEKAAEFVKRGFRMHTPTLELSREGS